MSNQVAEHLSVVSATVDDRSRIHDAYRQAFGFSKERSLTYIDQVGDENFRILASENQVAAVMAVIRTSHWLGGREVPTVNIAHVAVNPTWRGTGIAGQFLQSVCLEAAASGASLATLFASTRPVYRKSGFSLAGLEMVYEAETTALPKSRGAAFSEVRDVDVVGVIEPLYARFCATQNGLLNRSRAHWLSLLSGETAVYLSEIDSAPGYVVIDCSNPETLVIRDWAALNGQAATNILSFIRSFSSVYPIVRWHGSPQDALVFAMPDKGWRLFHQEEWLAKVLEPIAAMEGRGYAADGSVRLELSTPEATRAIDLTVSQGVGKCSPTGAELPTIKVPLNDLGTLITGNRSASFLARAGIVSSDPEALRICDAIFAGSSPWVGEHF